MTEATEVVRINSVSIEDNSRGTTAAVKAYGLTMQEAEDEAVASIQRVRARLKTIDHLQSKAPELAQALIGLVIAVERALNDHVQDYAAPMAYAYTVLAGAGIETSLAECGKALGYAERGVSHCRLAPGHPGQCHP